MNNRLKIVVIGGSGLIGTKLVNNLRQQGPLRKVSGFGSLIFLHSPSVCQRCLLTNK